MTPFSSRNTSLWRFNDVFRDEKCVIVPLTLSKKTTILILCNVVLSPVPIHSFFSRLKYPLVWPNMVVWWEIWISLISCNFTPFYLIKMGFSPEIIEFYAENWYKIFTTSFLNFYSGAKFGHYLWPHNSSHMGWNKNQLEGNLYYQPTSLPSFVTFDVFYFCLWPKTLSFERYGRKSPSNRQPGDFYRVYKEELRF